MALSKAEKAAYNDEIKDIKRDVEQVKKAINEAMIKKKKYPNIKGYLSLEIASREMDVIDDILKMNDLSVEMLGIKNNSLLESAKKEFYNLIKHMEEVVGSDIDRTLKENDLYLASINRLNQAQILTFIHRMHRVLNELKNKFGTDSKWKWLFVELQARVAVITKNITSFSEVAKFRDPRSDFFYERRDLMQLCKESLTEAARQFRTKYEMAGKARNDLKMSIEYLSALRKIHVLFGEDTEAVKLKNIIDAAKIALEAEDKAKDKNKKEKAKS
ncbi:MAG TPA: hypothetical protein PLA65_11390 [Spirochaetota bacterium]|nr:hypothetical protein [Spirochaetota bacterium]HPG49519.1 hypothetical protein [Spirochaetota bacterium]HPN12660.1 hypothetical protein [Spirochaetota bacterium]